MDTIKHSVFKISLKLWPRLLLASVFCFIVWFSIFALGTSLCSKETGYRIYQPDESGTKNVLVTEYRYSEGEGRPDTIPLDEEKNQVIYPIRENTPQAQTIIGCISLVFTVTIFGIFPYNILWHMGAHDENYVHLGRMEADKLFGLKVGLMSAIPYYLLYIALILGKFGVTNGIVIKGYRILNTAFIPYIDMVTQGAQSAADLSMGSLLAAGAVVVFLPLICATAYWLGFAQISIRESMIYKKKVK